MCVVFQILHLKQPIEDVGSKSCFLTLRNHDSALKKSRLHQTTFVTLSPDLDFVKSLRFFFHSASHGFRNACLENSYFLLCHVRHLTSITILSLPWPVEDVFVFGFFFETVFDLRGKISPGPTKKNHSWALYDEGF